MNNFNSHNDKIFMLALLSVMIVIFSMIMIFIEKFKSKPESASTAVYFSLISSILGLWAPNPRKKHATAETVDASTEASYPELQYID